MKTKKFDDEPEEDEGGDDDGGMGLFQEEDAGAGDEFLNVQPWKTQFKVPSNWRQPPNRQRNKPFIKAELEWVHGYRARDSKANISIMADGAVAYHAAAVGIVYERDSHTQRHFIKHTDDITAIAFHPDKK